ncbi:uncharacterized protein OCT59_002208 [Rhizophagus irregularis]|nr:hypothetical protein OCT59_002208 [Rhizophagus irregularis]GBC47152.1 hypothetical protein GLOIN_2v1014596 [Rhizophagus irregularis DAOM 181602=DAOM 197198]
MKRKTENFTFQWKIIKLEKRELQMDDIKIVLPMPISLFDHKLDQAYAEVEAEISGTSGHMGSLLRCNSYFFDDNAAYFSSPLSASSANTGNNRANFSRLPIPPGWLNVQPREKVLEQTNETAPDIPTTEIQEEKILRPSDGPSTPSTLSTLSTPKAENISPSECTRSLNSQPLERTRSIGQPLECTRSSDQHLECTRAGVHT